MNSYFGLDFSIRDIGAITGWALAALALAEFLYDRARKSTESNADSLGNILSWTIRHAILSVPAQWFAMQISPNWNFFDLHFSSGWATFLFCIILSDFIYYWHHRISHAIPLLWVSHSVHHSSTEFNISTTLRVSWFAIFVNTFYYLPLIWIGFPPFVVLVSRLFVFSYQIWIHSSKIKALPYLDKIVCTPNNHRFHHSNILTDHMSNYGGILVIWDRIFGTFTLEKRPVIYGLEGYKTNNNFVMIHFEPIVLFWRRLQNAKGARMKFLSIFVWNIKTKL